VDRLEYFLLDHLSTPPSRSFVTERFTKSGDPKVPTSFTLTDNESESFVGFAGSASVRYSPLSRLHPVAVTSQCRPAVNKEPSVSAESAQNLATESAYDSLSDS
jgi:hypothetical protein